MKSFSFRRLILLSILGLVIVLVASERLLSLWMEKRITKEIQASNISVQSLNVSIAGGSVEAYGLKWTQPANQNKADSSYIEAEELSLDGINIYHILKNRSLRAHTLTFSRGKISLASNPNDSARKAGELPSFGGLQIGAIRITNTWVQWRPDSATTWVADTDLTVTSLELKGHADPRRAASYEIHGDIEIRLKELKRKETGGYYTLEIADLLLKRDQHTLSCDSFMMIPTYSKIEFAHKKGTQSTWTAVNIPRIEIHGLDLNQHLDSTITASHILVSGARIEAFRDRRVPLRGKKEIPLPMKWMRELKLAVEVDTVTVKDMEIVYEHFAEKAFKSGRIRFSKLDGTFHNVINRSYSNVPPVTTLHATATVMSHGKIAADFKFPLEAGTPYEAHGHITHLPLSELNPMIEKAMFMSVETGYLNDLAFQFHYNNDVSTGKVEVDYKDLKVIGLTKDQESDVDPMKTLVANTALKNNTARTGTIHTERDKRRAIFHYWATSLMDGLRNAVVPAAPERKKK
jgi:hypothetical protein